MPADLPAQGARVAVSVREFVYMLVGGAALLALWTLVRYAGFGPRKIVWALAHVIVAYGLLLLLPVVLKLVDASGLPAADFVKLFGVALPLFVYAFLSGGWVTRASMELLR